ncbi:uncharacterized protein IUM83_19884, partial [Phytophthora cinnamomi]|uniref:uncharacterized protein n=1 Tax=Phytophthora cinnamomi TaxID=4785 RepID=UPI003559A6CE
KLLIKFGDLTLETFLLYQMLESGSPTVLIAIFTSIVVSNALMCAAMMFVPYERAPLAESIIDVMFDFLIAIGCPMLTLCYCLSTFSFDRAKFAINLAVFLQAGTGFSVAELVAKITKKPSNQKEVTNLFAKLKLFNERAKLFENAQFAEWTKAVEKGYKTNPEAALTAMVSTLRHQYRDEALVDMIAAAKKVAGTKDTATKLEKAQMKSWLSEEKSVEDAFRVFKLDKDKYSILSSPLLQNWVSYAKMTGTDPYKWLFAKMKAQNSMIVQLRM